MYCVADVLEVRYHLIIWGRFIEHSWIEVSWTEANSIEASWIAAAAVGLTVSLPNTCEL